MPEYCKVLGQITSTNASDPPINFELNLPTQWNVKTLQFGGGGFDGTVVTALGGIVNSPDEAPVPLARGYATYGSDGGNQQPTGGFGMNEQALANYGGEAVKRAHDAAVSLEKQYYGRAPYKSYFAGGSKGGHEALAAAQRYASDFDGSIAYYPANENQAIVFSWYRAWAAMYSTPGSYVNPAKAAALKAAVLQACDALDGVSDGIVGNTSACQQTFDVSVLRCPGGTDTGDTCLSDAQIAALKTAGSPTQFAFPLKNGVTSVGAYPVFQGGDMIGVLVDPTSSSGLGTGYNFLITPVITIWDKQDPASTIANFDYTQYQARVQHLSDVLDADDPNLDAFKAKGGKLLMVQGTTDMLVTSALTSAYYDQLSARYDGQLGSFVHYYVVPGFGHGGGDFNMRWDSLSALEDWVERGFAPTNQIGVDNAAATRGRTRPLCEYPAFPKYNGTGDVNSAASFTCATS
jgi:feruloyl esterase